jgi:hypothetical protein
MENRPSINDFPTFNLHFEGCSPYINLHIFRTMAVSQAKDVWLPSSNHPNCAGLFQFELGAKCSQCFVIQRCRGTALEAKGVW